jgi:hypothetical protein
MWKKIVQPDEPRMTTWRMRIECWITKYKLTHSDQAHVIPTAFPRQKRLHERASMLRLYVYCSYRRV